MPCKNTSHKRVLIVLNIIILGALLVLLLAEERRYRVLARTVEETGKELTVVAHQLRSPLSNMRKYQEFLQSKEFGVLTFAQQEALNKAQIALSESVVLLDRLLARSHLEEGRMSAEPVTVNVFESVTAAFNAVRAAAEKKKQRLTVTGMRNARVFADPLLLHGIFDELLFNAIHCTPDEGSIRVQIRQAGAKVTVTIADTGIGISDEERPHIFQKFFRGERAKQLYVGNGLGLAFSQLFAERMGGTISFQSAQDKGAAFTVTLPRTKRA